VLAYVYALGLRTDQTAPQHNNLPPNRASQLSPAFGAKHFVAWCSAVKRFVCAHSFVYRMGTHLSQRPPEEVSVEAKDYMHLIRPFLVGPHRDRRFIINMDQTPVYFAMNAKRTLELVGTKTIHVRTSTHDTKRATLAVTITADGTVLPLMVVFKGKPNGCIAKTEFAAYPAPHRYCCQENAWMDKMLMLAWVDKILRPYVEMAPDDVIPLLILDSYKCHMMALVVEKVQELGVEVKHIPGGCTSLCQPVDIGFNKLFKDCLRKLWISWMIAKGIIHGSTSSPMRKNIAMWVCDAMGEMSREGTIIRNAWLKTDCEWFNKNEGGGSYLGGRIVF
jgi:hypothetical protein